MKWYIRGELEGFGSGVRGASIFYGMRGCVRSPLPEVEDKFPIFTYLLHTLEV